MKKSQEQQQQEYEKTMKLEQIHFTLKLLCNSMIENARMMMNCYGNNDEKAFELLGVARITQEWYEEIEKETGIKANDKENAARKIKITELRFDKRKVSF